MAALIFRSLLAVVVLLSIHVCFVHTQQSREVSYTFCDQSYDVLVYGGLAPFYILSPGFNNWSYTNNQHCSLVIRTQWQPVILTFNYKYFDLQQGCDQLCVAGIQYSGYWLFGQTFTNIIQPWSSFTLGFNTDGSVILTGFAIYVTVEYASDQTVSIATSGYGDNPGNVSFANVTYSPDYNYTDKCEVSPPPPVDYTTPAWTQSWEETTTQSSEVTYSFCDQPNDVWVYGGLAPFLILSPGFNNGSYKDNQHCSLVIRTGWQPVILNFNYRYFDLEQWCDRLCVAGIQYSGNWLSGQTFTNIIQPGSSFTLAFNSDGSVIRTGFAIYVTVEYASDQTVSIATSGYGDNPGSVSFANVTYSPDYNYTDKCEVSPPPPVDYTTPAWTQSWEETTTQSSEVSYTFCDQPNDVWVYGGMTPFQIFSPGFNNGSYTNNQDCSLVIRTGWQPVILTFNYRHFDLESCCDGLCVAGIQYFGSWLTGRTFTNIIQPYSSFTISFRSDGSVINSGFAINVSVEPPSDQTVSIATSGDGHNPESISFSNVTYSPDYNYTDKCEASPPPPTVHDTTTAWPPNWQDNTNSSAQNVYSLCYDYYVNINASSDPLLIRSPYYMWGYYYMAVDCRLILRSGSEPLILTLIYRSLNLESCYGCTCDFLCVHGVNFCYQGYQGNTFQYILPAYSEFTLILKAGNSARGRDFEIQVSQEQAVNQTIDEAYGGVGDYYQNVAYSAVKFPLEQPYSDVCAETYNQQYYTTPPPTSSSCLSNVDEIDRTILQAYDTLNRARSLLRQNNYK